MIQRDVQIFLQRHLREQFGKMLELRTFSTVRRTAGILWRAEVVCPTAEGEVPVGRLSVDESGHLAERISNDDVVNALRAFQRVGEEGAALPEEQVSPAASELADFGLDDEPGGGGDEDLGFFFSDTYDEVRSQVDAHLERGTPEALREALRLLPRLLAFPERRAEALAEMAELEAELGSGDVALGYLEAAAREFSDRSHLEGLERVAATALRLLGHEAYGESLFKRMLTQAKSRIAPVTDLLELGYFTGLDPAARLAILTTVRHRTLAPGQDLVREGDPAEHAYVIESGQFSVLLEAPDGTARSIRCLFPGELVGEAAILTEESGHRSATVRADRVSSVWELDGPRMRQLLEDHSSLRTAIERARDLRRVHSFFSMHETMGQLDVQVRDELLSCIVRIARHPGGTVLIPPGGVPPVVALIAEGAIEYRLGGQTARRYGPDTFAGLRDAIHALETEGEYVVIEPSTLVEFDPDRLRALCDGASPAVIAVIERLE
jgi:CRP-like cAMP-binding protein